MYHDVPNAAYIAREDWKRMVSRTATGVIIGARPGKADDEPEIYIDLPETVAAWLAVRILDALAKPHTVNEIVAEEGYCPDGMTLEAARRTIAEAYAKAPPSTVLPAEFHTAGVMGAAFRLQDALGVESGVTSSAAVEAFRQGHIKAQRRNDRSRARYEDADEVKVRRAVEDLIGHLGLFTEGVDWESVDRFAEIAAKA